MRRSPAAAAVSATLGNSRSSVRRYQQAPAASKHIGRWHPEQRRAGRPRATMAPVGRGNGRRPPRAREHREECHRGTAASDALAPRTPRQALRAMPAGRRYDAGSQVAGRSTSATGRHRGQQRRPIRPSPARERARSTRSGAEGCGQPAGRDAFSSRAPMSHNSHASRPQQQHRAGVEDGVQVRHVSRTAGRRARSRRRGMRAPPRPPSVTP